jgi:exonuclease III
VVFGVILVPMKIISYNVRGLVVNKKPVVLCLQESKLIVVDDLLIKNIWGSSPSGFSFQSSIGASSGLLTVWDNNVVEVWSTMSFPHVLAIKGRVIETCQEFVIANVYAPCETASKQVKLYSAS